jgi:hypothetical protein
MRVRQCRKATPPAISRQATNPDPVGHSRSATSFVQLWTVGLGGNGGTNPRMTLTLRMMNCHAQLMGWGEHTWTTYKLAARPLIPLPRTNRGSTQVPIPPLQDLGYSGESPVMKKLGHFGTRRQLFSAIAVGAASVPFPALIHLPPWR